MAVTGDLPLTLGRNAISLTYASDVTDRASRIAPLSVALGGEATFLGFARWAIASPDSGTKTFVSEDPAGGGGPVGFDTQLVGMYVLLERTGESFLIVSTSADTQTIELATWSSSLVAGDIFQLRRTAPGTTYSAFSYRASVASVLPPPPGIPIQDAEVTAIAGSVITVRDGWLFGGVGPITVDGQHVGRSVRLSQLVAVDAITDFHVVSGTYVYSFADVSAYHVGDWMRRAAEVDGGFSHGDINGSGGISSAFPAAMEIVAVDAGANTVTVVSRDGLHRVIFDEAGVVSDAIRIYRPNATLRTVTASTASPKTLTLDSVAGFSIGGGDGAVEILIATTSTSGEVPWFLEHPIYIQPAPTGIGVKARTIDRSQAPTAYLGVQNLVTNPIGRLATTPGALPDGWLGAVSIGQVGTATPSNIAVTKNLDALFIKVGAQSWFFSTTNGVLYFPPIPWTAMYAGQVFSTRLPLFLTKWDGNAALITLQWGIMQADGTVIPWFDQARSVIIQPATAVSPRPDPPFKKFAANDWDDLVLNDFDITEPSTYPVTNRPNAGDITDMGAGLGLVACLVIEGGGSTVEGYIGGIAVVQAHEAPANVQEFYEANLLHQDTNSALRKAGPPQPKISVDFFDAKALNPALDEPDAKRGVMALIDGVGLGLANVRRRITDVKRNPNEPGRTQITLDETIVSLATATAKPPATSPTPASGGGTSGGGVTGGGSNAPSLVLTATFAGTVPTVTATVSPGVVSVRFAFSLAADPDSATVLAAVPVTTTPFAITLPAMTLGQTEHVAAIATDSNGVRSALVLLPVTLDLVVPWLYAKSRTNYFQDAGKATVAGLNDPVHTWGGAPGTTRDLVTRYPGSSDLWDPVEQGGAAIRFGNAAKTALGGRGAFALPDVSTVNAWTQGEIILVVQRQAAPVSDSDGAALLQIGAAGNGEDQFPRTADGHWISRFGSEKTYDLGPLASAIINGTDGPHTMRLTSSATRWAAYLDGALVHEDLSPLPAFDDILPVIGENFLGGHFNGWIWSVLLFDVVNTDAQAAAWDGVVVSDVTGGGTGGGGGPVTTDDPATLAAFAPTRIPADQTFHVPADKQVLIAMSIDVAGALVVDGSLIMVD